LDPGEIVILGGTAAVSAQIEAALAAYTDGDVIRRAGPDRFATAAAVSEASFPPGVAKVYIATGGNFPDGLTAGPAAALDSAPILLVGDTIPAPTAAELTRLAGG
ncbi:MAG TPA: cell wall-binding repeat-containing protein, partial [Egibacteraceae bacterium]|nr:cell wall-binding repeat-containing protein [Egibacteraceae bacterium]